MVEIVAEDKLPAIVGGGAHPCIAPTGDPVHATGMTTHLTIASLVMACAIAHGGARPQLIAHRGASVDAPENTLAAFRLAWEQRADGIEADLHLTRDGHIVCIHDADTRKVAAENLVVRDSTLEQLRRLDVGTRHHERFRGEQIPTLAEVLETVPPGKLIYLDIKVGVEIIPPLLAAIRESNVAPAQVVMLAFDAGVVRELKNQAPGFKTHWLCRVRRNRLTRRRSPTIEEVLATLRNSGADGLASRHTGISDACVRQVIAEGFEHHVWTVNCMQTADRFARLGTSSIITDVPANLLEHLTTPQIAP